MKKFDRCLIFTKHNLQFSRYIKSLIMQASTSKATIATKLRRRVIRTYMLMTEIVSFVMGLCQSGKTNKTIDVIEFSTINC